MRGMGTDANTFELLIGSKIVNIYDTGDSDCGLVLELSNGLCLYFGYSEGEGTTTTSAKDDLRESERGGFTEFSLKRL